MKLKKIRHAIGLFLFSKTNRDFLVFLFFLAVAGVFWLLMALNETYEKEFKVAVRCVDVPKNVVLTSDETDTLRVTLRDKGIILASYYWGDALKLIGVDFKSHVRSANKVSVASGELQKVLLSRLSNQTKVVSVKPDRLEFSFNYGESKQVPVRWRGRVMPEELYFISDTYYSEDSITIYAAQEKLDSIQVVYTEQLNYANFHDTLTVQCRLQRISGVKMIPDHVTVRFATDVLTDARIDGIPVEGINVPNGIQLRTFPPKVSVSFVSGVSTLKRLSAADFRVVVDYNEFKKSDVPQCDIYLVASPSGVSKVRLSQSNVECIEEVTR